METSELQITDLKVVYFAVWKTLDETGEVIRMKGDLNSHEIALIHFPEHVRREVLNVIKQAEDEKLKEEPW